jgi:hypothetical protein
LRLFRISAVQPAPLNRPVPGKGRPDKGADRISCNKLIVFAVDAILSGANLR